MKVFCVSKKVEYTCFRQKCVLNVMNECNVNVMTKNGR